MINMKDINISKIIYQKRKEKNMTQEELATHLNITKAAVSKWETGQSYPDITLLPALASLFNISIDNLIGYEPQMHKSDIKKLYHQLANEFTIKPFNEVYEKCQQIINKYYSCFELLLQMMILLMNHANLAKDPQLIYEEINNLALQIVNECDDLTIINQTKQIQSLVLLSLNRPLDIIELFPKIKEPLIVSETTIAQAYIMLNKYDDANEILQIYQYQYLLALLQNITNYIYFNVSDTPRVQMASKRLLQLIEIYELDKIHPSMILSVYANLAIVSIGQNEIFQTLTYLKKYVEIAICLEFPLTLKEDNYFDHLSSWFSQLDLGILAPRSDAAIIKSVQDVLTNPVFEPIQNNIEYLQLINKLDQHLGGFKHEH